MAGYNGRYNPNTYPYYQCDEEDYDSNASPEEQEASATVAAMRKAVAEVPVYVARAQEECYTFACICGWRKTLHVDDMAAYYEKPFAPCGHDWDGVECVG